MNPFIEGMNAHPYLYANTILVAALIALCLMFIVTCSDESNDDNDYSD